MHRLFQPITSLKYVAQKRAKLYAKLDITTPYDLLYHLPRHYMDYRNPISIAEAQNPQWFNRIQSHCSRRHRSNQHCSI